MATMREQRSPGPGMVHAIPAGGGESVVTTEESARRRGWQVVTPEEARQSDIAARAASAQPLAAATPELARPLEQIPTATAVAKLREFRGQTGPFPVDELAQGSGPTMPAVNLRGFRGASPEMLADAAAGVQRFQQGLSTTTGGGTQGRPAVDVARPNARSMALRAFQPLPAPAPDSETEGVATTAAPVAREIGDGEFAAAQQEGRNRALAANIGRAGAMAGQALSGVGFDGGAYDDLASGAELPVKDLLARRAADKEKALSDPDSEYSIRFRSAVQKAMPGVYSAEELAQMTAADEPFVAQYGTMAQRLNERAAERERQDQQRAEDVAFREREAAANRTDRAASRTASAEERNLRREEMQALLGQKQQEREAVRSEQQVERLADEYSKTGAPGFLQQYQTAKSIMDSPQYSDDLPGFGPLAGRLPDAVTSDDGVRLRQAVGQMLAEYRKGVTGAGMSDAERAEYSRITGLLESGTEDRVRLGIDTLKGSMDARIRALAAGKRPDAVQTYAERNPTFREQTAPPISPAAPAQPQEDMVPMVNPQGVRRMVPRARVQDAIAAGGRLVNG